MRVVDERADRVVHRRHSEGVGAHDDHVGALAGREAADAPVHAAGPRALDRRELEHVAAGQLDPRDRALAALARLRVVEAALGADRRSHRAEEVAAVGGSRRRSRGSGGSRRPAVARSRASRAPSAARCRATPMRSRRRRPSSRARRRRASCSARRSSSDRAGRARASCAIGRLRPHSPSPAWQLMRMPSSSASRQSACVTSIVANWLPRGARHSVTRASSELSRPSRTRRTSSAGCASELTGCQWRCPAAVAEDDARARLDRARRSRRRCAPAC